jgi:transcriptional regulator with XRE-family HTH domain
MKGKNRGRNDYQLKIGSFVRKWRVIKDLKQKELAMRLHLSEAAVSNLENDITVPTLRQIENIANALMIPVDMLLSGPEKILAEKIALKNTP